MLKKSAIVCLIFVVFALTVLEIINSKVERILKQPLAIHNEQVFTVEKGDSLKSILITFIDHKWIKSSSFSRLIYRMNPDYEHVKSGTYLLPKGATLEQVIDMFVSGKEYQYSITFVEGSRFTDWVRRLNHTESITHQIKGLSEAEIAKKLGISKEKLEGLFLAETYNYTKGASDLAILKRAHIKLQNALEKAWATRKSDLPLKSPYDALILASIIEKETAVENERKTVASVFVNRLKRRMRLQTDPTVIYGLGERFDGNLRKKDLSAPSPYNTYLHAGLPPTPIAMVGHSSIKAALNPKNSRYLYFVANGRGGHVFSTNLADHNTAVRHYIQRLRQQKK